MIITTSCEVIEIQKLSKSLHLYTFALNKYIPWEPGMFFYLNIYNDHFSNDWSNCKPFSFASYGGNNAKVLIRRTGEYTNEIFNKLKIGTIFYIKYAFGNFFLNTRSNKLLIAGGSGIAPFLSYIDWMKMHKINNLNYLMHSVKICSESALQMIDDIPKNCITEIFVTREISINGKNRRIHVKDVLNSIDNLDDFDVYLCGNTDFISTFSYELTKSGYSRIYIEHWK